MSKYPTRHYATDWVWTYSHVMGIARYVFLAIAHCMKGSRCETPATPVRALVALTGISEATIRRKIDEIAQAGEIVVVKTNRRGTEHRYVLGREVRLPLDLDPPDPPDRSERAVSPLRASGESPPRSPVRASSVTGQSEQSGHRSVRPVTASGALVQQASDPDREDLCTQDLRTTTATYQEKAAEAAALCAWIQGAYPEHNDGARMAPDPGAMPVLLELLTIWPPAHLQEMFVAFWTIREAEDEWCFRLRTRSIYAFRHAADRLDRIAIARTQPPVIPTSRLDPWERAKRAGLK